MTCGAVYFDQHRHAAHRGYGYVAVSRFRTQAGCHLYGKLRATDFLPVGPEQEDEQLYRGVESASASSENDERSSNDSDGGVSWNNPSDEDPDDTEEESVSRDDACSEVSSDDAEDQRRRNNDFDVSD